MKRYNENWHRVEICSYGVLEPLVNEEKIIQCYISILTVVYLNSML